MGIAEQVWGIGKRFEKIFGKIWLFDILLRTVWCKDLGIERERKSGKNGGKIFKMDVRGGLENARLFKKRSCKGIN